MGSQRLPRSQPVLIHRQPLITYRLRSAHAVGLVQYDPPGRPRERALLNDPHGVPLRLLTPPGRVLLPEGARAPGLAGHPLLVGARTGRYCLRRARPRRRAHPHALGAPRADRSVRLHPSASEGVGPADRLGGARSSGTSGGSHRAVVHRRPSGAAPGNATLARRRSRVHRRGHHLDPGALSAHRPRLGGVVALPHPRPDPGRQSAHRRSAGGLHQRHAPILETTRAPGHVRRSYRLGRRRRHRRRPGPPGIGHRGSCTGHRSGTRPEDGPLPRAAAAGGARAGGLPGGLLVGGLRPGGCEQGRRPSGQRPLRTDPRHPAQG